MKTLATVVFLLLGNAIIFASVQVGFSQFIPCSLIINSLRYPDSVPAGQTVQVFTAVTSSCYPSTPYSIRVDLLDGTTLRVLSTATLPYDPTSPNYAAYPIVNEVTAPSSPGPWVLQLQAYVVAVLSGQVVASTMEQFNINVTPYTPPITTTATTATTSTTAITTNAISLSQTSTTLASTSQVTRLNSTSTFSLTTTQSTDMNGTLLIAVAVAAILAGAIAVIAIERHRRPIATRTQGPANYCGHCGTKLKRNDPFCGNCGTPLKHQTPHQT